MRTLSAQETRPRQEYCDDRPAYDTSSRRTVHTEPQYPPYRHTDRSKQAVMREHTPWEVVCERSLDVTRDQVVPRFKCSQLTPSPKTETNSSRPSSSVVQVEDDAAGEVLVPAKKRQRYLRDVDRHSIVRRIENGEKQATLAREFGVTRAAICHIKKNREEIVSRYESLVQSAKEMYGVLSSLSVCECFLKLT
jgi:DNA-binding XRE family transcriptional regulator